jgi:hypothetical protein
MRHVGRIVAPLLLLAAGAADAAPPEPACPVQPMPSPLASLDEGKSFGKAIAFAAVPSFDRSAWAMRVSRLGPDKGALEILRLERQGECNRYDIVQRWDVPIDAAGYAAIVSQVSPFLVPPPDTFSHTDAMRGLDEIGIDGTGLELRGDGDRFEVRRGLHQSGKDGATVSAIFHRLLADHVPPAQLPSEDWRSPD